MRVYHHNMKSPRNAKFVITQIRVDGAAKTEITARLGLKATHPTSHRVGSKFSVSFYISDLCCQMVTHLSADATSRLEEISEQTHALYINAVDSRLMVCCWSVFCT